MGVNDPELLAFEEQNMLRELASRNPLPANQAEITEAAIKHGLMNHYQLHKPQLIQLDEAEDKVGLNYVNSTLQALTKLYLSHPTMESLLQKASRLVVDFLNLEHCSIGWLCEKACGIEVWTSHTRDGAEVDHSRVHQAFAGLVNRQPPSCNNRSGNPLHYLESACELWRECEIVAPLRIDNQIVGYICGLKNADNEGLFSATEKSIFITMSHHISAAIEAQRTREMLDSPYVALALTPNEREYLTGLSSLERPFMVPTCNPEILVRKIARRLCADLHRAGFEIKQLMCVATEILDSLLVVEREAKSRSSQ